MLQDVTKSYLVTELMNMYKLGKMCHKTSHPEPSYKIRVMCFLRLVKFINSPRFYFDYAIKNRILLYHNK